MMVPPELYWVRRSSTTVKHQLNSIGSLQAYYQFAQQQLAVAGNHQPIASHALTGLGKLQNHLALNAQARGSARGPKALAYYHAALLIDAQNYLAANELAVLMARYGKFQQSRQLLEHSIAVRPMPETWHNLAVVHDKMGQPQLAQFARQKSSIPPKSHKSPCSGYLMASSHKRPARRTS